MIRLRWAYGKSFENGVCRGAYDLLGRTATITSYGDTNNDGILDVVRNQIQYAYDDYDATLNPGGWGGVATVWQQNDGAVNTSTSPNVQYGYDSLARLVSVTHPSGFEVAYDYSGGEAGRTGCGGPVRADRGNAPAVVLRPPARRGGGH